MNQLDILLPFALPQADIARDLLRECKAPALSMLLSRAKTVAPDQRHDSFSRALPHEHWLSTQLGLSPDTPEQVDERGNSPAVAAALLRRLSQQNPAMTDVKEGHWFVLQPAHLHVARDHLVLNNIDQLQLDDAESRRLFQSAHALFEEIGHALHYVDASTWLMRADDWAGLRTSSPQAASGRNIDIWMPAGNGERAWRKLQNEVQMQWFSEGHNEAREMRGLKAINSLWIWGGANASTAATAATAAASQYQASFNLRGWSQALAGSAPAQDSVSMDMVLANPAQSSLLVLDDLLEPGLTNDWGIWLERLELLEQRWFVPLLQALGNKRLHNLGLILSGQDQLRHFNTTPSSLRKFWVKSSLSRLTP